MAQEAPSTDETAATEPTAAAPQRAKPPTKATLRDAAARGGDEIAARTLKRDAERLAKKGITALPPVERVAAEELTELAEAQQAVQQTQAAVQQAHEAATKVQGIAEYLDARLRQRYQIGPEDRVQPDGTIVRATAAEGS
jgi:hypothetical protein